MARALRVLYAVALLVAAPGALPAANEPSPEALRSEAPSVGEAIYRFGRLPSGQPLRGERESGVHADGVDAACVRCHRRSGLGGAEGRGFIPPITGQFLFHAKTDNRQDRDLPYVEGARPKRDPYTDETLARAIRDGLGVDGKPFSMLMPRFAMDDASMAALIAYLRELSPKSQPGVVGTVLHFATIVTADADPVKRDAMLAVLKDFFTEKNGNARAISQQMYAYRKQLF